MTKKKNTHSLISIALALLIGAASLYAGKSDAKPDTHEVQAEEAEQQSAQLEIPRMKNGKQGQVIRRTGYTLAFDKKNKTPQWVAWELTRDETRGNADRTDYFETDPDVKGARVEYHDYSGSGYDRGHMAPAGDMKWSNRAMKESFYMSNMCPQDHNLNTKDWNDLETKCRQWARRYGKVYIVCGPIYNGKRTEYIGEHRVKVPDAFYKAVLINTKKNPIALGFYFENEAGERPLEEYLVPVDKIEAMSGIDFFPALNDEVEERLESKKHQELP